MQSVELALYLPLRLVDPHGDVERFRAAAVAGAANRRGAEIVEADRDPHVGVGCADAVRRVEGDPAELRHVRLGPGMAGALLHDAVGAVEIAADIAARNAEHA